MSPHETGSRQEETRDDGSRAEEPSDRGGFGQSVRVLHVDDEPGFAELTAAFLERTTEDITVVGETSARDGLERFETERIDCIVSDYDMPRMNGLEFLQEIRERDDEVPFILFTGKGSEEVASDAIAAGVTDYLQKEAGADQYEVLANRIHNYVSKTRAQRALDHTEEEFRHLVDAVVDHAIFKFDLNGYVTSWNQGAEAIMGYRQDEIVGKHVSVFYTESAREEGRPVRHLENAAANNYAKEEGWRVRKDGSRFWANVAITALYDDDGTLRGFANVTRDMTEQKRQREALRAEKERFRSMVQEVQDYAIFMLDSDGYVTTWNAGAEQIKGYRREEILGEHFSTFYADEDVDDGLPGRLLNRARTDERVEDEGWRVRKDGSRFWADVVITALHDHDGDVRGFSKVTRDMTERRAYQQQLESQTERMEELLRLVSHDLQGLLSVARERLELARETDDVAHFATVETALERASSIVGEVLAVSEDGIAIRDPSRVSLDDVAKRVWEMIDTERATLTVDDPGHVVADEVQLQSIFENLFRNAVTHGGDVEVRVGALENGFYVADDGPGIPEEDREAVLEYGYSTLETGSGLGLNIVRTLAEGRGWSVTVTESSAGGTRIEITGISTTE